MWKRCDGWAWGAWRCGSSGNAISTGGPRPSGTPNAAGGQRFFPPLQRVQIERAACTEPAAYGLHWSRWDCRRLAQVVSERAVGDSIHHTTVARILAAASLQPHRRRYWKTAIIDEQFTTLAAKILWCDGRIGWLHQRGEVVICPDEQPHLQAPSRCAPTQPMQPGQIERREFDYKRHGTVTLLVSLHVYEGQMGGAVWTPVATTIPCGAYAKWPGGIAPPGVSH